MMIRVVYTEESMDFVTIFSLLQKTKSPQNKSSRIFY